MTDPRQRLSSGVARVAAARESLRERAAPHLGIDPRALGAFRVAVALLVLADLLVYRLPAVRTFYTDAGVLPRAALAESFPLLERASLFALSGSAGVQTALLAVAVCAAGSLLAGYRTRASTAVVLVLLGSLYARNPYVINGGNSILAVFLFVSLFLPLDARWAVGGGRPGGRGVPGGVGDGPRDGSETRRVCTLGTAVALLTLVSIYAANAVSKYRSDAWMSGVAVPRIFQLGEFTVRLGPLLADRVALLTAVNWVWIALLAASPLLVVATGRFRAGLAAAFAGAHLGMAATMRLAVFPFVMCAILLCFLPPRVWDRAAAAASRTRGRVSPLLPDRLSGGEAGGAADRTRADGRGAVGPSAAGPSPLRRAARSGAAVALVGFFVALVWWQAAGVGLVDLPADGAAGDLSEVSWSFFAPNPPDASSWYVVAGTLESGATVDVRDGGAVGYDRPPDAAATYPTTLWHQFGFRLQGAAESRYRAVAAYVCERSDRDLSSVAVAHVEGPVDPSGPVGDPTVEERVGVAC